MEIENRVENIEVDVARIGELEASLQQLNNSVVSVNKKLDGLNESVAELGDVTDGLQHSVVSLHETDADLIQDFEKLNETVRNSEDEINYLKEDIVRLFENLDNLNESVNNWIIEVESRMSRLEYDGIIAFNAEMGTYVSIPEATTVIFPIVHQNLRNGYDPSLGQFTVTPGGDGLYYFYVHFFFARGEYASFDLKHNNVIVCVVFEDEIEGGDRAGAGCGGVVTVQVGKMVFLPNTDLLFRCNITPKR